MSRLKFSIININGESRTGCIPLKDLCPTFNEIKTHRNYVGQQLTRPIISLLIQHMFMVTYRLEDVESITLKTNLWGTTNVDT